MNFDKISANCECGKNKHRRGSLYCTKCGNVLDIDIKPSINNPKIYQSKDTFPINYNEDDTFKGTEVASAPFFVNAEGFYWHIGKRHEIFRGSHLPQMFGKYEKGDLLGIVCPDFLSPWALIVWKKLIVLYNGFSCKTLMLRYCKNGTDEEYYRKPGVIQINSYGNQGRLFRFLLSIRKKGYIYIQPYDFILKKQKNEEYRWWVQPKGALNPLPVKNICLITEPFIYKRKNQKDQLFQCIVLKGNKSLTLIFDSNA